MAADCSCAGSVHIRKAAQGARHGPAPAPGNSRTVGAPILQGERLTVRRPRTAKREERMSFISRLRRLEDERSLCAGGACPECARRPLRTYPYCPEEGEPAPSVPSCPSCGRDLGILLRVEYEGEGALLR